MPESKKIIKNEENSCEEKKIESKDDSELNQEIVEEVENASTLEVIEKISKIEINLNNDDEDGKISSQSAEKDALVLTKKNTESDIEDPVKEQQITKSIRDSVTLTLAPYSSRRSLISTDRINELRRKAQEASKQNKIFTIRGSFQSVRSALNSRGWVEKLDIHRKHITSVQVSYDELTQKLPKRKTGESRRHYIAKCERNIMSRFLEHIPIDFLWTNRKEKCDYIDQAKNPGMIINKFHRAPFTTKEGLCNQLKDFHWFFEEGTAELYFPRCYNVWSPEELNEFIENFKLTGCISFIRYIITTYQNEGFDGVFSPIGKIPFSSIEFAYKRCHEFLDSCQHNDIDGEETVRIWEHDWDAFLLQHYQMVNENGRITSDQQRSLESLIKAGNQILEKIQCYWPQYSLDGMQNLWIVKPANKCRGRGILLMDNLKKILNIVNPSIATKSRYVVQKYIERPLILFQTKFDIRQWFLITNVQPLVVWMYKESYLRFSSQEYNLRNHHESVHLTNHAIQKKYTNGKRDKRLPSENMWDCYSFQAYLRQIGKQGMWQDRIYPGMKKAIVGTLLASQDNMDRRPNTFELFGADFMICENFYPWLIEINSSPDLGASTSVTARMCPQCLEDVVKVVIDRKLDTKSDLGNFELAYRQNVPQTPAYMGLNLYVKGRQLVQKSHNENHSFHYSLPVRERLYNQNHNSCRQRACTSTIISKVHRVMPVFNATEMVEKYYTEGQLNSNRRCSTTNTNNSIVITQNLNSIHKLNGISKLSVPNTVTPNANLINQPRLALERKKNILHEVKLRSMVSKAILDATNEKIRRQRSCVPRLNTAKVFKKAEVPTKVLKLIKVCKNSPHKAFQNEKDASCKTSKCSKSDTNLLELLTNTKKNFNVPDRSRRVSSNQDSIQNLLSPASYIMQGKSLSDCDSLTVDSRKWKAVLLKSSNKTSEKELSKSPRLCMGNSLEKRNTQSINAVGKGLTVSFVTNSVLSSKLSATTTQENCLNIPRDIKHLVSPRPLENRLAANVDTVLS